MIDGQSVFKFKYTGTVENKEKFCSDMIKIMRINQLHIIGVIVVTVLFALFTLMHHYDWLLPASPVNVVSTSPAIPFPDAVEEHGGEDDIDHDFSKPSYLPKSLTSKSSYMVFEDLFIPQISTPPPDYMI